MTTIKKYLSEIAMQSQTNFPSNVSFLESWPTFVKVFNGSKPDRKHLYLGHSSLMRATRRQPQLCVILDSTIAAPE